MGQLRKLDDVPWALGLFSAARMIDCRFASRFSRRLFRCVIRISIVDGAMLGSR